VGKAGRLRDRVHEAVVDILQEGMVDGIGFEGSQFRLVLG
jgi:hypothetical protein